MILPWIYVVVASFSTSLFFAYACGWLGQSRTQWVSLLYTPSLSSYISFPLIVILFHDPFPSV